MLSNEEINELTEEELEEYAEWLADLRYDRHGL